MEFKNYYYCSNCNGIVHLKVFVSKRDNSLIVNTKSLYPYVNKSSNIFTLEDESETYRDYLEFGLGTTTLLSLDQTIDELVKCDSCNHKLFIIDENIIPVVYLLNTQGIRTNFSCSGHVENKTEANHFYLVLDIEESKEDKLNKLINYLDKNEFRVTREKSIFNDGEIMVIRGGQKENSLVNVGKLTMFLIENEL